MADIVDDLRATSSALPGDYATGKRRTVCDDAADEIETLRVALMGFVDAIGSLPRARALDLDGEWLRARETLRIPALNEGSEHE